MVDLPKMPARIAKLPRDHRGFPVPWFVQFFSADKKPWPSGHGEPDFRVADARKYTLALRLSRCWVCGEPLGKHKIFVIGPMCVINRVTSEPPCHRECAEFSATACPFLVRPRMRRNEKDLPEGGEVAGLHIDRNPGAVCLYETKEWYTFKPDAGGAGVLIRLAAPIRVDWYAAGRRATRAEVLASIESGLPHLQKLAERDGPAAVKELAKCINSTLRLLPVEPNAVERTNTIERATLAESA